MPTTIDAAAEDFARHTAGGGGWALGLLVACCVERGKGEGGGGTDGSHRRNHDGEKVSARAFATKANTSADRVLRYLDAWDRAAKAKVVNPASTHTPDEWNNADWLPTGHEWSTFYDGTADVGRTLKDPTRREKITAAAEAVGVGQSKALDVASNPRAIAAALEADHALAIEVNRHRSEMSQPIARATGQPTRPQPDLSHPADIRWMHTASLIEKLGSVVGQIRRDVDDNRDVWQADISRPQSLRENAARLTGLVALIEGVTDEALADLLDGRA